MCFDHKDARLALMSQIECKVEKISEYIDTKYSGGDTNKMKLKQLYQEENNNDIDEITKNFDMGCIVDTVKRPPNICVETCVYNSESESEKSEENDENDDHYSDEFEEDSEVEEIKIVTKSVSGSSSKIQLDNDQTNKSVKMSKSHTSVSSKPQSISGRSDYGSISVPQTRRINMSFTNERLREIERHNHILLNKILGARNNKKCAAKDPAIKPVPSAAVHRKLKQRQIDHDNMILLKKYNGLNLRPTVFDVDINSAPRCAQALDSSSLLNIFLLLILLRIFI